MLRTSGVPVGVSMADAMDGGMVQIQTVGVDETADLGAIQHTASMVLGEARQAGVSIPGPLMLTEARAIPFMLTEVQVFYLGGRPVEARVAGHRAEIDHWTEDNQPVLLFPPWSSEPAPRWAEDGGLLPEDAARAHWAVKASSAMLDGELKPTLRRLWNLSEHANAAFLPWRGLRDLAEAEAEQPEDLQRVARLVLNVLKANAEGAAEFALTDAGAPWRDRLVRELKKRLRELRRAAGMSGDAPPAVDVGANVTEAAAEWLAQTFPIEGAESAEELRRRADAGPWAPWAPEDGEDFAFLLRRLVTLTWRNGLEAEAEHSRAKRPALVRAVAMDEMAALQAGQLELPTLESRELRDGRRLVATIDAEATDLAAVHHGLQVLRTPAGNRLVKSLVITAHRQHEAGETDPRTVQYDGGWSGLAEVIRYTNKNLTDLKALAKFGQHVQWETRDGIRRGGGWWTWGEDRGVRGRPGFVRFILNDCLMPDFAAGLAVDGGHSLRAREARRLVPELPYEPPTGGIHQHHHGAVWTLHRLFLVELVDHAEKLAEDGVVAIPDARWKKLAEKAGLPLRELERVLDSWTEGESVEAPKLMDRDGTGFRLAAEVYQPEHDFLATAGVARKRGRTRKRKG